MPPRRTKRAQANAKGKQGVDSEEAMETIPLKQDEKAPINLTGSLQTEPKSSEVTAEPNNNNPERENNDLTTATKSALFG
jgi:hypothetical protein